MNELLREKTAKVLAQYLGCTVDVAEKILEGMDKEAKEQKQTFEECACEMA